MTSFPDIQSASRPASALWVVCAAFAMLVLTIAAYHTGLGGPFLLDDGVNFLMMPTMKLQDLGLRALGDAAFSTGAAYPDRPLARVTFALNHYFAGGFEPLPFKITNLAIHLLCAVLLWTLLHRLLARRHGAGAGEPVIAGRPWWVWCAFLAALLWVLHPLHVSTTLYVVQRMTSLSALFTLAGLLLFVLGRERVERAPVSGLVMMTAGVGFGGVLAALCKENGVLIPFFAFAIELVFFERTALGRPARNAVRAFYALGVVLPVVAGLLFMALDWDFISSRYEYRDFTVLERLMTQGRALWFYIGLLLIPRQREFGIFHDDFAVSHGLLDPATTLVSLVAWALVVAAALYGLRRRWLFSFAVIWFLAGHAMESSILPLEMVFEHRNYLPSASITLLFAALVTRGLPVVLPKARTVMALALALVLCVGGVTFTRASIWDSDHTLMLFGVRNHPDSARYHGAWATILSHDRGDLREIYEHLRIAARLKPGDVAVLYDMSRAVDGQLLRMGAPPAWAGDQDTRPEVDVLEHPLPEDRETLEKLAAALDLELSRRAREEHLPANAAEIARHQETCLHVDDPLCPRVRDVALRWIDLIMRNPTLLRSSRALSAIARAKVLAAHGDLDRALASMKYAQQVEPGAPLFRFHAVTFFLTLGLLDDAQRELDAAEKLIGIQPYGVTVLEQLRAALARARTGDTAAAAAAAAAALPPVTLPAQ